MEGGEILRGEIVNVARGRQTDGGGIGGEPDGETEVAGEKAVNQPGDE
jgi:hypothetical protein